VLAYEFIENRQFVAKTDQNSVFLRCEFLRVLKTSIFCSLSIGVSL
jgi:hypothetical protein